MLTHLLVPIAGAPWGDGANDLELLAPGETSTPVQLRLLQAGLQRQAQAQRLAQRALEALGAANIGLLH